MTSAAKPSATPASSLWEGIQAIVFDAVGTLIEPSPAVAEVYARAAGRQGISIEPAVVKTRFREAFRNDEIDEARGPVATNESVERRRWQRIVGTVLPEVPDPERAFTELWRHFETAGAWGCFADVAPALRIVAERRIAAGIASNFDARLRTVVAGLPALSGISEQLVISSEVGYRKPHAAFFEAVTTRFGLPAERILFVGDDLDNDAIGASRAGLRGVLLDRHGHGGPSDVVAFPNLHALVATLPLS